MDDRWDRESVGEYEKVLRERVCDSYGHCEMGEEENMYMELPEREELDLSDYVCNACL
jgi:hypothetical protein